MKICICIPAFNEIAIIKQNVNLLTNWLNQSTYNWELVLSINGSSDGTIQAAKELTFDSDTKIRVLEIKTPGKGRAIFSAFQSTNADILVFLDIDLSVSPEQLPALIEPLFGNIDLTYGSRFAKGSHTDRGYWREISSRLYMYISRILIPHQISDLQCGFKAMKSSTFKAIRQKIKDKKWFFDTEILIFAEKIGLHIQEVPIEWQEERYQKRRSKLRPAKEFLIFLIKLVELRSRIKKIKK